MLLYSQLQCGLDQPTRSFPGKLIQQQRDSRSFSFKTMGGKLVQGVCFLQLVSPLLGVLSPQGRAAFPVLAFLDSWRSLSRGQRVTACACASQTGFKPAPGTMQSECDQSSTPYASDSTGHTEARYRSTAECLVSVVPLYSG